MGWNRPRLKGVIRRPFSRRPSHLLFTVSVLTPSQTRCISSNCTALLRSLLLWSQQVGVSQERDSDEQRNEPDQICRTWIAPVYGLNEDHHANADRDRH